MKFTQFGTFTVVTLLLATAFNVLMALRMNQAFTSSFYIVWGTTLLLLICILLFYKLTIEVDNQYLRFKFGIGIIGKKYNLSDIKTCRAVQNSFWYGFGIRKLSNGWLYNVSGLSAIELTFKNKDGVIRIGTNQAQEVADFINQKLELTYKELVS